MCSHGRSSWPLHSMSTILWLQECTVIWREVMDAPPGLFTQCQPSCGFKNALWSDVQSWTLLLASSLNVNPPVASRMHCDLTCSHGRSFWPLHLMSTLLWLQECTVIWRAIMDAPPGLFTQCQPSRGFKNALWSDVYCIRAHWSLTTVWLTVVDKMFRVIFTSYIMETGLKWPIETLNQEPLLNTEQRSLKNSERLQ